MVFRFSYKYILIQLMSYYGMQDLEVNYFHAYIDRVDFVFIDSPVFHHLENNIYGGDRLVKVFCNFNTCKLVNPVYSLFVTSFFCALKIQKWPSTSYLYCLSLINAGNLETDGIVMQGSCRGISFVLNNIFNYPWCT